MANSLARPIRPAGTASNQRVLAIASGGGHWVQLMRLRKAFGEMDVAFASVYPEYVHDVQGHRFYSFPDVHRLKKTAVLNTVLAICGVLLRERPHVIVTTGSAPGLIAIVLGKALLGARTIWIDSVANCERLSGSGKRAKKFADLWLTQWEHLASEDGPQFWGAVL